MKKAKREFVESRNEALYQAYKKALSDKSVKSQREAVRKALSAPQSRMWMPFYSVYRMLLRIVYSSRNPPKRASRSGLEQEVATKYRRLSRQRIFRGASLFFLASFIIAEPSRGFYLSELSAISIVCRMGKQKRKEWREKH